MGRSRRSSVTSSKQTGRGRVGSRVRGPKLTQEAKQTITVLVFDANKPDPWSVVEVPPENDEGHSAAIKNLIGPYHPRHNTYGYWYYQAATGTSGEKLGFFKMERVPDPFGFNRVVWMRDDSQHDITAEDSEKVKRLCVRIGYFEDDTRDDDGAEEEIPETSAIPVTPEVVTGNSFRSVYEGMTIAELIKQPIPDEEQPAESRLAYCRVCANHVKRGQLEYKQLVYRIGKVIATFKPGKKEAKEFDSWVTDEFDITSRCARNYLAYAEKVPEEVVNDPSTTFTEDCKTHKIIGANGQPLWGNGKPKGKSKRQPLTLENVQKRTSDLAVKVSELTTGISKLWIKSKVKTGGILENVHGELSRMKQSLETVLTDLEEQLELVTA